LMTAMTATHEYLNLFYLLYRFGPFAQLMHDIIQSHILL